MTELKTKGVALYYRVEEYIKEKITSKEWPENYKLPAEPDLAAQLKVSRATIRQAIHDLVDEGLLIRQHGKGTFVADHIYEGNFIKCYFPVELGKYHEMISFTREGADVSVAKHLQLPENESVYAIFRVRYISESREPAVLEKSFLRSSAYPGLERHELNGDVRLYDILTEHYDVRMDSFVTEIQATTLSAAEAAVLKCKKGTPVLLMTRTCSDSMGVPLVMTRSILRPDKCKIVIHDKL